MTELNFKQLIYGGMIAIAGVDGEVDKIEKKWVETVFKKDFGMCKKEKREVLKAWENNKTEFTDMVIKDLKGFHIHDQKEAFKRICQFILYRNEEYNRSTKPMGKGLDSEKDQLNRYRERADIIRDGLDF